MYKTQCTEIEIEGETRVIYGAANMEGICYDFTTDIEEANRLVDFLNKNEVELCHVPEIIEDLFYSCG